MENKFKDFAYFFIQDGQALKNAEAKAEEAVNLEIFRQLKDQSRDSIIEAFIAGANWAKMEYVGEYSNDKAMNIDFEKVEDFNDNSIHEWVKLEWTLDPDSDFYEDDVDWPDGIVYFPNAFAAPASFVEVGSEMRKEAEKFIEEIQSHLKDKTNREWKICME